MDWKVILPITRCYIPSIISINSFNSINIDSTNSINSTISFECFNDWGGWGYDDSVPRGVTKTTPSGDRTT